MTPMTLGSRMRPTLALALTLSILSACATAPAAKALAVGEQATLEGKVISVDTAPWAYDGNAVVTIATTGAGPIRVQLPARWNRCKAQPLGDIQALKPDDPVEVVGTVTAADELVVCGQAEDRLRKVE